MKKKIPALSGQNRTNIMVNFVTKYEMKPLPWQVNCSTVVLSSPTMAIISDIECDSLMWMGQVWKYHVMQLLVTPFPSLSSDMHSVCFSYKMYSQQSTTTDTHNHSFVHSWVATLTMESIDNRLTQRYFAATNNVSKCSTTHLQHFKLGAHQCCLEVNVGKVPLLLNIAYLRLDHVWNAHSCHDN